MDLVYIILAHKNPYQLKRLIDKLNEKDSYFYIHLDIKADIDKFKSALNGKNISFLSDRYDCTWSDFSIVKATINLISATLQNHSDGFCILLSGQDYPLKTKVDIRQFLESNSDFNFFSSKRIEEVWNRQECIRRTKEYRFNLFKERNTANTFILNGRSLTLFIKGKLPFSFFKQLFRPRTICIDLYGGSQWWISNLKTLKKIYHYIDENWDWLSDYFKYTHCADEIFFQSIIEKLRLTDSKVLIKDSLTYVNWSRQNCTLPVTFGGEDATELLSLPSEILFARKFDYDYDYQIIEIIDSKIEG